MKKSLITLGIVGGIVLLPVLGMAITPTRDLIMGLAPDQAVLSLADKIDENRVNSDQKSAELQSLIDTQRNQIAEQQSIIDGQKAELDDQKSDVAQAKSDISNEANCRKAQELFATVPESGNGACRALGPTNIVQAYEKAKWSYNDAKNGDVSDKDAAIKCTKKYLERVEPAYNQYMSAKKLCNEQ